MPASQNLTAALLILASSAILSLADNFVASVSEEAGLWQFQVFRTLFAIPLLLVLAFALKQTIRPKNLLRMTLRSLAVAIGLLIYFAALGTLPVAQAAAGLFSAPIWVLLLSALLFASRITLLQILCIVGGFSGVLMLLQPDLSTLSVLSLFPLTAGLFYGLGVLLTRFWCREETAMALAMNIFLTMGLACLFILVGVTFFVDTDTPGFLTRGWESPTPRFLWLTLAQAFGAVIAVSLIGQAYRIGTPSRVSIIEYSFLVFASLWAFLLWGTTTNTAAFAGIGLIVISGLVMTLKAPKES